MRATLWTLAGALTLFFLQTPSILAQTTRKVDFARMERDLDIMEGILDKLCFEEQDFGLSRNRTRGLYLPGLGVLFQIDQSGLFTVRLKTRKSERGREEEEVTVTAQPKAEREKEEILQPIFEFLGSYADAIGQLQPQDKIVVIYGSGARRFPGFSEFQLFMAGGEKAPSSWAVIATRKDISDLHRGRIDEKQFRRRLNVVELGRQPKKLPDLRIMASVLQTGFSGYEDQSFRISGDVDYFHLPDFGAVFLFDVQYSSSRSFDVFVNLEGMQKNLEAYKKAMQEYNRQMQRYSEQMQKAVKRGETPPAAPVAPVPPVQAWAHTTVKDSLRSQHMTEAFTRFQDQLRQYLLDYGRTLRVVKPQQWVVVSVKTRRRYEGLPRRMVMQVKKADLERYDARKISRKEALHRIQVTYYDR